jgi:hypothetical protein
VPNGRRADLLRDRILGWHRSPLKVAGVAFVGWLLVWDTCRTVFATDQGKHPWLDWIVVASIAYSAAAEFVLIPRLLSPKAFRRAADPERVPLMIASMRLAVAGTPFMFGLALVGAGADQWVATAAMLTSTLLLISYVRSTRASLASP